MNLYWIVVLCAAAGAVASKEKGSSRTRGGQKPRRSDSVGRESQLSRGLDGEQSMVCSLYQPKLGESTVKHFRVSPVSEDEHSSTTEHRESGYTSDYQSRSHSSPSSYQHPIERPKQTKPTPNHQSNTPHNDYHSLQQESSQQQHPQHPSYVDEDQVYRGYVPNNFNRHH
jgi:hypothetical protein